MDLAKRAARLERLSRDTGLAPQEVAEALEREDIIVSDDYFDTPEQPKGRAFQKRAPGVDESLGAAISLELKKRAKKQTQKKERKAEIRALMSERGISKRAAKALLKCDRSLAKLQSVLESERNGEQLLAKSAPANDPFAGRRYAEAL